MINKSKRVTLFLTALLITLPSAQAAKKKHRASGAEAEITGTVRTTLWREPQNIRARNLFYGPGGAEHAPPTSTFTFRKEDLKGTNPKFDVEDDNGVKWKVKLGSEARPETVASRLVWAVGYFANEDYFVPVIHVHEMPARLRRGPPLVEPDGTSYDTRLKRELKGEKKIDTWHWRSGPFTGTREWNGLRVLMALINNWDLKDENNAVYEEHDQNSDELRRVYMVTDLGASFGDVRLTRDRKFSKGNLALYQDSKFIDRVDSEYVDFDTPHRPAAVVLVNPHEYFSRVRIDWVGKHVPRADARWIGELLSQLSTSQIRDAFRAGGYSPQVVDGFTTVVESRIAELKKL